MNDIRRTILWVIFGFSMVLLWDQWQVFNGQKPTFFPPATTAATVDTATAIGTCGPLAPQPTDGVPGTPANPTLPPDPRDLHSPWTAAPPLAADTSHEDEMIFPKYK